MGCADLRHGELVDDVPVLHQEPHHSRHSLRAQGGSHTCAQKVDERRRRLGESEAAVVAVHVLQRPDGDRPLGGEPRRDLPQWLCRIDVSTGVIAGDAAVPGMLTMPAGPLGDVGRALGMGAQDGCFGDSAAYRF